ncbi:MAG TPA: hypothetical protein PL001_12960, partial [Candidatus Kryptobacter bacterium]|nr:hypothetical protein [Candidatus Kryptobacter bacterium]
MLQERTYSGLDSIPLDPVITYISPSTNIRISFSGERLRELLQQTEVGDIERELDSLRNISDRLVQWKNGKVDSLTEVKSGLTDSIQSAAVDKAIERVMAEYRERQTPVKAEMSRITRGLAQVDLTIQARVILHTGKEYDLSVPGYTNVDSQITEGTKQITTTSIEHGHYRLTPDGLESGLADTELDLISARLGADDMVRLTVTNHFGGVARVYEMRFFVSDFGWKLEFPVTMIFVKRIREVTDSAGNAVNPSNFKPAPGGSMLLTYQPIGGVTKQLFCSFGIGINASLVNFDLGKDFQLGIGPVLYYFNRSVGVGYGWDLNATEKREYWFLSLDFL